jgi:nitrite reductase/ring-hydroxylating ferredoxin subunit
VQLQRARRSNGAGRSTRKSPDTLRRNRACQSSPCANWNGRSSHLDIGCPAPDPDGPVEHRTTTRRRVILSTASARASLRELRVRQVAARPRSAGAIRSEPEGGVSVITENEQWPSRRKFTRALTLAGLAIAAGGAWRLVRRRFSKTYPERVVAQAGEIPVGGSKIFAYPTDVAPCVLLRPAQDSYVAYSRLCTHASCPVFYRSAENRLVCPCHGGAFSVADGSVLQGPPPRPLPRIRLEQRGSDLVALGIVQS